MDRTANSPGLARTVARIIGLEDPPGGRDQKVEANARLTGSTGLLLIVLLFIEGVTIPLIGQLVSWHIFIGLVLVPPILVKMGAVLWRFSHYYGGDPGFRAAGPPHLILRALGPFVALSTVVLFGSGIALWLLGRGDRMIFLAHQLSFVVWFVVVAIHVLAHLLRATRLAAADASDARGSRTVDPHRRRRARARRRLLGASLVLGLLIGVSARAVGSSWTGNLADRPPAHAWSTSRSTGGVTLPK